MAKRVAPTLAYVAACAEGRWSLRLWYRNEGRSRSWASPYVCGAWRHEGPCAESSHRQLYARIMAGVRDHPGGYVFMVLTFGQNRNGRTWAWRNMERCYRGAWRPWQRLWGRLKYRFAVGHYAIVVEAHRSSGYPHLNVMFRCPELAEALAADKRMYGPEAGQKRAESWLRDLAVKCGFGFKLYMDVARDAEAVAGYLSKLLAEITKGSQLPVVAPPRFRRLRSSRGFLPPRIRDPGITGKLERCSPRALRAHLGIRGEIGYSVDSERRLHRVGTRGETIITRKLVEVAPGKLQWVDFEKFRPIRAGPDPPLPVYEPVHPLVDGIDFT